MIKPEDISDDILNLAMERFKDAYWGILAKQNVADLLEDAIKAGIVSPPCRILRSQWGSLQTDAIYIDDNAAQAAASPGDSSEHWKGQTE